MAHRLTQMAWRQRMRLRQGRPARALGLRLHPHSSPPFLETELFPRGEEEA